MKSFYHQKDTGQVAFRSWKYSRLSRGLLSATLPIFVLLTMASSLAAQSGTAFRDFNGDGLRTGAEPGVEGVIVKLYIDATLPQKDQLIGTTVTGADGTYNFAVSVTSGRAANAGEQVRVEFDVPSSFECTLAEIADYEGQSGNVYGTSVQFIVGQASGVDFAINYPGQWVSNPNPTVFLPCYAFGDPSLPSSDVANDPAFVSYPFLQSGVPASHSEGTPGVPDPVALATVVEVGSLYGVAFSRPAQKIFTSAVMRRHCGLGPLGPGGIYLIDPNAPGADKTTDFLNLDAIGIWTWDHNLNAYPANPGNNTSPVTGFVGTNAQRGLPANRHTPSTDLAAGDQVGKVSIGDIDISDDGRYLYVMNLWDRKLYEIDLVDPKNPQAPTLANVATRVRSWSVPDPATYAAQGEHRPFGLKFYRGKLYVGVVLSGQNLAGNVVSAILNGNGADIRGYVFEFSPSGAGTFASTPSLDFSFVYGRERPWIPWGYSTLSSLSRFFSGTEREIAEPIISDIEFDDEGNMLIGVLDRKGHQYAINNNDYNGNLVGYEYSTAGELLRTAVSQGPNGCTYEIVTRPGTADYYADNLWHSESVQGPLAVLPGQNQALAVWLDPIKIRSGGTIRLDNITGAQITNSAYEVFDDRFTLNAPVNNSATASKANGLGDVELSGADAPIELGNRIWADMDRDGIQDPGEPGIPGVDVQLKTTGGTVLATVQTGPTGEFYFNTTNVFDGDPATAGQQLGPQPFTQYKICIPASEFGDNQPLNNFLVTAVNQSGAGLGDYTDNDGVLLPNGDVQIMFTTGASGQNDHTLDFGVIPTDYGDLPNTYTTTEGSGGPWHYVTPDLKLGTCVDGETNGQPQAMAGMMTGGDDNTVGYVTAGTCTDDEDGIVFTSPLIPGQTACITVTATNRTGAIAYLQGWIDFNGNGTFETGERLNTGDFDPVGGRADIPNGGVTNVEYCFTVPSTATFQGGVAFARFRITPNGVPSPGGGGIDGEVEDYKVTLAKVGNLVWSDFNDNGIQNAGETGINGVTITLTYLGTDQEEGGGDDVAYTTTTSNMVGSDGIYMFLGLIPGNYVVGPTPPPGYQPGKEDQGGNDVLDSDEHDGVFFTIPADISLTLNENGTGDNPGGTNGFPDLQDELTFDFNYIGLDYGDLPPSYGTTTPNGPAHAVTPDLKLGTRVDAEANGQPDAMAGAMTGGDDNTQGAPAFGGAGDDEDGIVFSGPMVPGSTGCIRVSAMNSTGSAAVLQGWIDWNGDGDFDANEQLTTGQFAPNGASIPTGMITNQQFCFTVPSDAVFATGNIMSRFRLSPAGGLSATGGLPNGGVPLGEVEDYKTSTAKIGNFVWWDFNNDGLQNEAGSAGINGVTVNLTWAGPDGNLATTADNVTFTDVTAADNGTNGQYAFCGLVPGTYSLNVPTPPANFVPTQLNQGGNDVVDADNPAGVTIVIPTLPGLITGENGVGDAPGTDFPDNQDDLTYDFGYVAYDYGDLPDSYGTTTGSNGASQLLNPNLYLGTCVDAETNGQPEAMAGLMTGGDDNNSTSTLVGSCGTAADDENGIVLFETPLIPGYSACVRVTAVNLTGSNAVLQGWIDFNGNGTFESNEQLTTGNFAPTGALIPNGGVTNMQMCFDVPSTATFNGGNAFFRFRLSQNGGLAATGPAGIGGIGEVEDYKVALAKIGNYVWNDWDNNGQQNEPGAAGLNNITVNLVWAGTDLAFGTPDDRLYTQVTATEGPVEGKYNFCGLIPGSYKVSLPTLPTNYIATQINVGSGVSDSDNPAGVMVMIPALPGLPTGENATGDDPGTNNGFPDNQDNLTIDFGLITRDFGDAPDTYGTTDGSPSDGPVHVLNPNLKLGACADGDPDGQPEPMAGLMTGGDDNGTGMNTDGTASTCGDDEDGIMLVSPLVPGSTATIMVTAMNMLGSNAVLQGWIDYNGDGDFADANEALTFTNVNGGTVPSPAGLSGAKLTFVVPAGATFTGGNAFMRFRISPAGGLTPNGPENMPFPVGEVEDYKVPLAKIGNYVWNDNNNDGIQNEPGSNGLNGTTVQLVWPGPDGDFATTADNLTYTQVTSNMNGTNGQYMFLGLTPGMYKASIPTNPSGFIPTQLNQGGNDVTDADDPAGQMLVIPNPPTTLPTGENGTGDVPNDPNFPDPQNDLTIDFGFVSVDYGDLPSTYGTTIADGGPKHIVNPNLKLGSSVDGELNGQPEAMAGFMTGGDDGNNGGYNEGGAGDDENGVTFLTPMIPGTQACIRVNAMNTLGGTAVLQGWIDFNGDGDVADAGEELSTGSFAAAANGAIVPAGTGNTDFCFDVPANATFFGGNAFSRFRLSPTGGLTAGGPAAMPYPIGEVEDYKLPLAKAGNYVWIDANVNGIQDENGVLGINNVTVQLQWAGPDGNFNTTVDNRTYTDVTAAEGLINGKYIFCGLIPGNYRMVVPPFGYVPTLVIDVAGNTQDVVDSDNPAGVNFTVPNPATTLPTGENGTGDSPLVVNGFPDNQANFTFDFGYLGFDFGDAPETYGTTQGAGNPGPDGAVHTVNPNLILGPSVDVDLDGQPDAMAGFMTGGDDNNIGPGTLPTSATPGDDENGVSFPTPLIPGNQACVKVSAVNSTGSPAVLQAWIDFNGNNVFDAGEQLTTGAFAPAGAVIPVGGVTAQNFCFDVPANAVFTNGNLFVRFRLSPLGGLPSTGPAIPGSGIFPSGEVEDYKLPLALIGNYVWMDNPDIEGDQDAAEMALANVKLNLTWAGEDGVFQTAANSGVPTGDDRVYMTTTDANGRYEFRGLIPSTNYRLMPDKYTAANQAASEGINPANKILTIPNLPASDFSDSDGAPRIDISIPNLTTVFLTTGENSLQDGNNGGFPDAQNNLSLDFGFIDVPRIAAAMKIMGFQKASSGICGHFDVIMDVCVKNNSTAPLASLQAVLDLAGANAYGTAFLGIVPTGAPQIVSSNAQSNPTLNAAYNGGSNQNLFNGTSGLLWPGEQVCVRIRFEVDPEAAGAPANPKAQAVVSGKAQNFQGVPIPDFFNGGAQFVATDASDSGSNPMSTNPDDPSDLGTADDPTLLGDCWEITQDLVANDLVHVSVPEDCVVLINSTQVLEGEIEECTEYYFPLGGFYKITIFTQNNQPVPNPIPLSYIGQTLIFKAEHIMTCNITWGTLKLEDKLAPEVVCTDIHLNCAVTTYTPTYLQNTLGIDAAYPEVFDCTATTSTFVDVWHDLACGEGVNDQEDLSAYVERKWTVTDAWGNTSTCLQYIYFDRIHVQDVEYPTDIVVSCGTGNTSPAVTGAPHFEDLGQTWTLWPEVGFCETSVTYSDSRIPVCDGTYKIERVWRVHDWCQPTSAFPPLYNPFFYIQIITVMDNEGPQIACPADLTVSTNPSQCCATVDLPNAIVTDNCSRVNNISAMVVTFDVYTGEQSGMYTVGGTLTTFPGNNLWASDTLGNWGLTPCLPVGNQLVTYTAQDDCGNTNTCQFNLSIEDLTPPEVACVEFTQVALGNDGQTLTNATSFDNGSYDNCGPVYFLARRMDDNTCQDETTFYDQVRFCCSDIGDTVTVILRVFDVNPGSHPVANGTDVAGLSIDEFEGHWNECMVQVYVEDKIKPVCQAPANVTVACENFDPSLWAYGQGTAVDNCCLDTVTTSVSYASFDTICNRGTIVRTFRAFDCYGNSSQCTQRIVVNYNQYYFVKFPDDKTVGNCTPGGDYGKPVFYGEDCELLATSFVDEVFTVNDGACFKIERTWTVINWCTYNQNNPLVYVPNPNPLGPQANQQQFTGPTVSAPNNGIAGWTASVFTIDPGGAQWNYGTQSWAANVNGYRYKQIIKVYDNNAPVVNTQPYTCDPTAATGNDPQLWNSMFWYDAAIASHDLCEEPVGLKLTATDLCAGANVTVHYLLYLDLDNDGVMETVVNSQNPLASGALQPGEVLFGNAASPNFLSGQPQRFDFRTIAGSNPPVALPVQDRWVFSVYSTADTLNRSARVVFRRGNQNAADANSPVVQLPHGTHKIKWIVEDGCGNQTVQEETFTVGDCKKPTVVCKNGLSINIMQTGTVTLWASDFLLYGEDNCTPAGLLNYGIRKSDTGTGFPTATSVTFDCTELGTQEVELWAVDKAGNADFCETYVLVQDNMGACGSNNNASIAGALKTEEIEGVQDANVELEGMSNGLPMFNEVFSNETGNYAFSNALPIGADYTVTPTSDIDPTNGVTTYDLVLINRHILGLEPLGTPYKMIAADANKSNTITTFDIVEIRKLILGIYNEFPSNESWRFIDQSQVFSNPQNPFADVLRENISVAQIQSSAVDDDFVGVKIGDVNGTATPNQLVTNDDRSAGTLYFDVNDRHVAAGEEVTVTFKATDKQLGYQFTLNLNGLNVTGIEPGANMSDENFAVFAEANAVTTSVNGGAGEFAIKFRATQAGQLSQMLGVSSRITKAEAYSETSDKLDIALRFNSKDGNTTVSGLGFELYQNVPNPWVSKTTIGFHLPEAAEATLTVYDETGRTIYTMKGQFAKGYNAVALDRKVAASAVGLIYYRLETATNAATRKMVQTK